MSMKPMTPPENRESKMGADIRSGHQPKTVKSIDHVGSTNGEGVRFKMPSGSSPMTGGEGMRTPEKM